jgi:glutamate N-acetyltransferase/amino-acid N-acetyltransferase
MKQIEGGVTAAKGFTAAGIHCGIRKNQSKRDLALIFAECDCTAAAVYTTNRVKAAPLYVTMENLEDGHARAFICNSGNANACAPGGYENARRMCRAAANALHIGENELIVDSTGVIGQPLNIEAIEKSVPALAASLTKEGAVQAAEAIMTTDTIKKQAAVQVTIGGKTVTVGGMAKGSGMIHPNMATMFGIITTECAITPAMLHEALTESVKKTFNRVSVDGDTSTNDMAAVLASGLAGNEQIEWKNTDYTVFQEALYTVCDALAKSIARDGEGASRLVVCSMKNARSEETAEKLAMSVISSSLVKAAMFGADANWGRVLCAMGYSKAPFRPEYVDIRFKSAAGSVLVCENGAGLDFDEELAKNILAQDEVVIEVNLKEGSFEARAYGCDLTYDYVKINGDYRT